jgi:hypothetical protein
MVGASTPLWPAGHLPLKGGDRELHLCRPNYHVEEWRKPKSRRISPLEGEMPGKAEGGAMGRQPMERF